MRDVEAYRFDGSDPEEGLLILAREERSSAIEGWLANLQSQYDLTKKPVPYDRAMADFERIAKTTLRGVAADGPNASESDHEMFKNFVPKLAASEGVSRDGSTKWFQQILHVSRKEKD